MIYAILLLLHIDGLTMSDIRYKWNDGLDSVQISSDVSLPQWKILGHRQKTMEASTSTGTLYVILTLKVHNIGGKISKYRFN